VVTLPYGVHWGINLEDTINLAINYGEAIQWPPVALRLPRAHKMCSLRKIGKHPLLFLPIEEILVAFGVSKAKLESFNNGNLNEFPVDFPIIDLDNTYGMKCISDQTNLSAKSQQTIRPDSPIFFRHLRLSSDISDDETCSIDSLEVRPSICPSVVSNYEDEEREVPNILKLHAAPSRDELWETCVNLKTEL